MTMGDPNLILTTVTQRGKIKIQSNQEISPFVQKHTKQNSDNDIQYYKSQGDNTKK